MTQRRSQSDIAADVTRKTERNVLDQYSQYQAYFRFFMVSEPLALRRELPDPSEWFVVAETGGSADTQADIDNVEIVSLGGISRTNGVGLSTVFTFDITQPSSVSVLDSILAAKDQLNIKQFLRIPYFLELTFRARDPDSSDPLNWTELSDQRRVWPLLITTTNTRVTSQGSVTSVEARFYPDLAMSHESQKTREQIEITASTVEEFLTKFAEQMTKPPDDSSEREEKAKLKLERYEIRLDESLKEVGKEQLKPTDEDNENRIVTINRVVPENILGPEVARTLALNNLSQSAQVQTEALALATQKAIEERSVQAQELESEEASSRRIFIDRDAAPGSTIAAVVRRLFSPQPELEFSPVPDTPAAAADSAADSDSRVRLSEISRQDIVELISQVAEERLQETLEEGDTRVDVQKGQTIENVIIATMMTTKYFQKNFAANASSDNTNSTECNTDLSEAAKFKQLFRIVPDIQLALPDPSPGDSSEESQLKYNEYLNDYEKKYIYTIVPYEASTYMASPQDVGLLPTDVDDYVKRGNLLRAYNYNFTGLNNAVLNLDLNFNFRWNLALAKQAGQTQNTRADGGEPPVDTETSNQTCDSQQAPQGESRTISPPALATGDPREALQFVDGLNTTGRNIISVLFEQMLTPLGRDLVELDLEIRGDPFWLEPDPMPNTTGTVPSYRVGKPTTVRNNSTTQQTYFLLTTYLPEPYQRETGLIPPPGNSTILAGVYSVRQVVSKFNQGKFTQTLNAIKDVRLNINSIRTDKDGNPVVVGDNVT